MATDATQNPTPDPTPGPTWYDILGVGRDATPDEIKAAWRTATDKFEPGAGSTQFRLFNEAADVLLDPARRAAYDAELGPEPGDETASPPEPTPPPDAVSLDKPVTGDDTAGDDTAVEEPAVEEPAAEDAEPRAGAAATGPLGALARLSNLVVGILAVLAVAALVLAVVLAIRVQQRVDEAEAAPQAAAAAERALVPVLSYDYRHMEADRDRAAQYLTPSYRKDYLKTFNELIATGPEGGPGPAVKTQAVVTADVLDTGVVDYESDRVRVIAFVNQTSVKGEDKPIYLQNRLVVTMEHRGDRWLVANIKSY